MEKSTKLPETTTARTQVNLPDEVVLLIFSYLPVQALLRARRVSTQWKSVAEDPSLLKDGVYYSANRLHVCVLGLPSSGKSTLIGHQKKGWPPNPWSAVADIRKEEQERGRTVGMHHIEIKLSFSHSVTFWNVAGWRDSLDHVYRVAYMSDVAFLVIPANEQLYLKENHTIFQDNPKKEGEKEDTGEKQKERLDKRRYFLNDAGAACLGILNEQLLLAKTAGVKRVLVLINWMDSHPPEEGRRVFESIRDHILSSGLLKKAGFTSDPSLIVPCSAWKNINLFKKGFDWFDGPTVMEALHRMALNQLNYLYPIQGHKKETNAKSDPLIMSIQEVFKITGIGTIICGRVTSGVLDTTSRHSTLNSVTMRKDNALQSFKVGSIAGNNVAISRARPGDYVGLCLAGFTVSWSALKRVIPRGQIVVSPLSFTGQPSAFRYKLVNRFRVFAQVVGAHRRQMHIGVILVALIRCNHLRCEITSLRLADRNKKPISEKDEKKPGSVTPTLFARTGDFVLLVLTLHGGDEVILANDRIALRDNETTLAVGTITVGSALEPPIPTKLTAPPTKPFRGAERDLRYI